MITQHETQRKKIFHYLKDNGSGTIRELFIYCNVNSPSKRLSEMRARGLIVDRKNDKPNADGRVIPYKIYSLAKGADISKC